jgi:aspartate kinase
VSTPVLEHRRTGRVDDAPAVRGSGLSVVKIGGSILRDAEAYAIAAGFLARRLNGKAGRQSCAPRERLVAIVSAQYGVTDALLAEAQSITPGPSSEALDLLWSTGELRSVALLALQLQRHGIDAAPLNVHQTGLVAEAAAGVVVRPLHLQTALTHRSVVVVPGFLGVDASGAVRSLGRGGSDLTAVLLAAAIGADRCELVKDVPGYHTSDPNLDPGAQPIRALSTDEALRMAEAGCDLVQRAALVAAAEANLPLIIRSIDDAAPYSFVLPRSQYGVLNQDDSRRPAVGA